MSKALTLIGLIALAVTLVAPFAYLVGGASLSIAQWLMLVGTLAWFVASGLKLFAAEAETAE